MHALLCPECECGHTLMVPLDALLGPGGTPRGIYCPSCDAAYEASPYQVDDKVLVDWKLRRNGRTVKTEEDWKEEVAELKADVKALEKDAERYQDEEHDASRWKHELVLVGKALGLGAEWNVYEALDVIRKLQGEKR